MRLVDARDGEVEIALEAEPHHLNLQGLLHGGVLATLADTATGWPCGPSWRPDDGTSRSSWACST